MCKKDSHRFSLHGIYFLKNFLSIITRIHDQHFTGFFIFQKIAVGKYLAQHTLLHFKLTHKISSVYRVSPLFFLHQ